MLKFLRENPKKFIVILTFFLLNLFSVLKMNGELGLYLDAVNPDYLSVQFLNKNTYSFSMTLPYIGIPLLGQAYHGTVTMLVSMAVIMITGCTSTLQLYITNCIYGTAAVYLLYMLLLKSGANKKTSFASCFLLLLSPNLTAAYVTQYYIELPGIIFSLLMFLYLTDWKTSANNQKLLLAGLFGGIAIYSYFNFLFFFPFVLLTVIKSSTKAKGFKLHKNIFTLLTGYAFGCTPYILGYISLVLLSVDNLSSQNRSIYLLIAAALIFISLIYLYKLQSSSKNNILPSSLIILSGCTLLFIVGIYIYNNYQGYFNGLNIAGTPGNLFVRLKYLYHNLILVLFHSALEYLVMNKYVTHYLFIIPLTTFILSVYVFILQHTNSAHIDTEKYKFIKKAFCCILIYFLCSIGMATRMQGQHFVCMIFIMYFIFGECLTILLEYWSAHNPKPIQKVLKPGICVIAIVLLMDQTSVVLGIQSVPEANNANPYYSTAINNLSEMATTEKKNGKRQYYVFPEWGMSCGFDYLTMNTIGFGGTIDPQTLQWLRDEQGYELIICYWDQENKEKYVTNLTYVFEDNEIKEFCICGNYADILALKIERK